MILGCGVHNKPAKSPQSVVGPAGNSEQAGLFNWCTGLFKGMFDSSNWDFSRTNTKENVEEVSGVKVTTIIQKSNGFWKYIILVGVILILGKTVSDLTQEIGKRNDKFIAAEIKTRYNVNPLIHPIKWFQGKFVRMMAKSTNSKVNV